MPGPGDGWAGDVPTPPDKAGSSTLCWAIAAAIISVSRIAISAWPGTVCRRCSGVGTERRRDSRAGNLLSRSSDVCCGPKAMCNQCESIMLSSSVVNACLRPISSCDATGCVRPGFAVSQQRHDSRVKFSQTTSQLALRSVSHEWFMELDLLILWTQIEHTDSGLDLRVSQQKS